MDAFAEVCNEETCLRDAGLLQSSSVLAALSLVAHPTAPASLTSPPIALPTARDESVGLHCDHCDRDGHVEVFCCRKRKAQKT
jgi:hypothetical protein